MNNFLIYACAALGLALGVSVFLNVRWYNALAACEAPKPVPASSYAGSPLAATPVDTFTDAGGSKHSVFDATATAWIDRRKNELAAPVLAKRDSIAKAAGIKPNRLEGYAATSFSIKADSVRWLRAALDSQRRMTRFYRDKYLTMTSYDGTPGDTADPGYFDYNYAAEIGSTDYTVGKRFLGIPVGKQRLMTDIWGSDPRMTINGHEKLTLERHKPPFGARLEATATLNPKTLAYLVGAGLRIDLGEDLNMGFNYFYSPERDEWIPNIYAKGVLLRIGPR